MTTKAEGGWIPFSNNITADEYWVPLWVRDGEKIIRSNGHVFQFRKFEGWVYIGQGWHIFAREEEDK